MEKWLLHNSTAEKNFELNQQIRELIQKFAKFCEIYVFSPFVNNITRFFYLAILIESSFRLLFEPWSRPSNFP
jgi:hypothetical protein